MSTLQSQITSKKIKDSTKIMLICLKSINSLLLICLTLFLQQCKIDTLDIKDESIINNNLPAKAPISNTLAQLQISAIPAGIGVSNHNLNESLVGLQKMYDAGIRYIRYDLAWNLVETTAGVYNFTQYDLAYSRANQIGLKLMFIFDYTNPLYDGNHSPYTTAGRNAFLNYARTSISHFQGKGIIWEIYNEPTNFWIFPDGTKPNFQDLTSVLNSEAQYAPLANSISYDTKLNFPNETIVGPGMAWCDGMVSPGFNNTLAFLRSWYQSGSCYNLDAVSIHPYRQVSPEYATNDYTIFRNDINNPTYNDTGKYPLLICGEWGYSSGWVGIGGNTYDEREVWKSKNVPRLVLTNLMNNIPITILYDWMNDGTDPSNPEHQFGLVLPYDKNSSNPSITVLNSYNALKTLTTKLNGYTFSSRLNVGSSTDYILSFTNGSSTCYVCWNQNGTANTVNIPVGSNKSISVTNYDGTSVVNTTSGVNGYSCQLSDAPQYIIVTTYFKIQSRWKTSQYTYDGGTRVKYGTGTSDAYLWSLENYDGYTRIRNKQTGEYMNVESGPTNLNCTTIWSGAHSNHWSMNTISGSWKSIKSRWTGNYINNEDQLGYEECDMNYIPSDSGWLSEQWNFIPQ